MLRRKLILNLCPLVALLLLTGVVAVYLLQGVLQDIRHVSAHEWQVVEDVNELGVIISAAQAELQALDVGTEPVTESLLASAARATALVAGLRDSHAVREPQAGDLYAQLAGTLPEFVRNVDAMTIAGHEPTVAEQHRERAVAAALVLQQDALALSRAVRDHAGREQQALARDFRWVVLGLAIVFLILINGSIAILIRMAVLILRPVDKLVAATAALGQERFDVRISLDERDEFDQLASAYNDLAERLQEHDRRRMEVLGQVGLAMNHELNNALAIIELQLQLLERRAHGDVALDKCTREIHDSLRRMTRAVENLRNVRRIVLTDYVPGIKMLDLERSVGDEVLTPTEPTDPTDPHHTCASS